MEIGMIKEQDITEKLQIQVTALYKQLNADNTQRPLQEILNEDNKVHFAVCRINGKLAGIALLATYKVISGHRGMVEDVVVDPAYRGKGIGRKLMEKLLEEGREQGLDGIMLFTGHHRTAAINLYKSLGFTKRESGLYNLKLK